MISLVIPAYNEAASIEATLRDAHAYLASRGEPFEIIVAADGDDGTREVARTVAGSAPEIVVIGSPERRGKGRGVREAVAMANGDVIGFTDADNKTPITEFDQIEPQLTAGADLVIGSRAMAASRIERAQPRYRQLGSRLFFWLVRLSVGLFGIADTQCGFKFFRGDVAKDLFALQRIDGYMFDVEILYLARKRGYRLAQVPVRWRDDNDSRLQLVAGSVRNMRDLFSIRWRHRHLRAQVPAAAERISR